MDYPATVAALSRTCRLIHNEVATILYADKFTVWLHGPIEFLRSPISLDFLSQLQKVTIYFAFGIGRDNPATDVKEWLCMAGKMVDRLHTSDQLQVMSFHYGTTNAQVLGCEGLNSQVGELRRMTTKAGVKAGKNAKERELDYAQSVIKHMKRVTGVDAKTAEDKGSP